MPYSVIIFSLFCAAAFSLAATTYIWRHRHNAPAVANPMILMMGAIAWWIMCYAVQISMSDVMRKLIAHRAEYLGIVLVPVAWFLFAVNYSQNQTRVPRRIFALLFVLPAITTILVWTSGLNNLMWVGDVVAGVGSFSVIDSLPGTWFWVHATYSYLLILAGSYVLVRQFTRSPRLYRRQLIALFISVIFPIVANVITIFGGGHVDLTPFAFTITGLALTWGLLRFQLLDLAPIAHETVIAGMTDGMLVIDVQERIIALNPAATQIIGASESQLVGQSVMEVIPILREKPETAIRFRTGEVTEDVLYIERGDLKRYLDVRVSPLCDEEGRMTGRVVVFRDVSASKQAEIRIQEQNAALMRINEELALARFQAEQATILKSQFLANMSHELRTPLTAIIGYTELQLAGMTGPLTQEQSDFQGRVLASAEHLLALINDILDLSKIEAGRMDILRKPFALREWADEIVRQHQVLATAKELQFEMCIDERLPETVIGDAARLKQVVINLVSNAIKFTDEGSVRMEIADHDQEMWKIVVSDTGIGIPSHLQETVFDEFRQVDNSSTRRHGGTGLGLAIVRRLVLMMGGTIRLKSEVGKGTTFTVFVPYVKDTVAVA